jgi:hypothetical protein
MPSREFDNLLMLTAKQVFSYPDENDPVGPNTRNGEWFTVDPAHDSSLFQVFGTIYGEGGRDTELKLKSHESKSVRAMARLGIYYSPSDGPEFEQYVLTTEGEVFYAEAFSVFAEVEEKRFSAVEAKIAV